jgi:hypothetical protein
VLVQVQVTVPPAATVSTAGLTDPLCPLLKEMFPTAMAAVSGGVPPPAGGPPVSPPAGGGDVGELPEHPASTARAIAVRRRLNMRAPVLNAIV